MRKIPGFSVLFGILAAVIASAAVWLAANCRENPPVLLAVPEAAVRQAETVMDALCTGDFASARKGLYGTPDLDADRKPADMVGQLIWKAYVDSLDYELVGDVYATDTGLAQDVKIISLELPAATEKLGQRAQALLQQGVEQARSVSEIYDENNAYKESFVAEVLEEATRQALEEDVRYTYQVVSLQLVCSDGRWWVLPDRALLNAISGSTAQQEG